MRSDRVVLPDRQGFDREKKSITMKTLNRMKIAIRLHLPTMRSYFCGRRPSAVAVAAHRRGNAAGTHGGGGKYGTHERRKNRLEERAARLREPDR